MLQNSEAGRRCLKYIEARAEELDVEYDLTPNHLNEDYLVRTWDACLQYEEGTGSVEVMQALCDNLLDSSIVTRMQGMAHIEPKDISEYQKLFNTSSAMLHMVDVPYTPPSPIEIDLTWEIQADEDAVLKLTPNQQLKLWDDEVIASN